MKKIFIYSLFVISLLASCSKPENPQPSQGETPDSPLEEDVQIYSLTVALPELQKKTTIGYENEKYRVYWQNGDVISAGEDNLSQPLTGLTDNSTTVEFTFGKPVSDGDFVLYPGAEDPSVLVIPAEQTSIAGQYDPQASPLWGTVAVTSTTVPSARLSLNNTMAMILFAIKGTATLTKVSIEALGGEVLNGTFDFSTDGTVSNGVNTTDVTEISFQTPLALSAETPAELYVPVLPATYSKGFSLRLYDSEGKMMKVNFFEEGQALTSANLAEFSITYSGGRVEVISPLSILGSQTAAYEDDAPANSIKVGTYNIFATSSREDKSVSPYRRYEYAMPYVAETIVAMDCDVICFNEISEDTYSTSGTYSLENAVNDAGGSGYTFKINNPNTVSGSFFWQTEDFSYANGFAFKNTVTLDEMGKFWLNSSVSTSSDSDSGGNRTCVWGKFIQVATGKTFYVLSTHLSIAAQGTSGGSVENGYWNLQTAKNLIKGIGDRVTSDESAPVIIAGDLNSSATTANQGYNYLVNAISDDANSLPFTDSRVYLATKGKLLSSEVGIVGTSVGTDNNSSRLRQSIYCLDHILFRNCEVSGYMTYRKTYTVPADDSKMYWYPSDHLPLSVFVTLP